MVNEKMCSFIVWTFVALTGPSGLIWIESRNVVAVATAPPGGNAATIVITSGGREFFVKETPEQVMRMIQLKCD